MAFLASQAMKLFDNDAEPAVMSSAPMTVSIADNDYRVGKVVGSGALDHVASLSITPQAKLEQISMSLGDVTARNERVERLGPLLKELESVTTKENKLAAKHQDIQVGSSVQQNIDDATRREREADKWEKSVLECSVKQFERQRRQDASQRERKVKQRHDFEKIWNALNLDGGVYGGVGIRKRVASFTWLLVILGTDLDLIGFIIAFFTYYSCASPPQKPNSESASIVIRGFLAYGVLSYCLAARLMTEEASGSPCISSILGIQYGSRPARASSPRRSRTSSSQKPLLSTTIISASDLPDVVVPKASKLQVYHFVPIIRSYIIVKDRCANDVECLFRVNALSTFTLGVAQIVGMLLGHSMGHLKLGGLIYFGLVAQMINVLVTILYFGTPLPVILMNMAAIEAVERHLMKDLQRFFCRYEHGIQQRLNKGGKEADDVLKQFHALANAEIFERANANGLGVEHLTMTQKMKILVALRRQAAETFTCISLV